jgi:hypothetical protein
MTHPPPRHWHRATFMEDWEDFLHQQDPDTDEYEFALKLFENALHNFRKPISTGGQAPQSRQGRSAPGRMGGCGPPSHGCAAGARGTTAELREPAASHRAACAFRPGRQLRGSPARPQFAPSLARRLCQPEAHVAPGGADLPAHRDRGDSGRQRRDPDEAAPPDASAPLSQAACVCSWAATSRWSGA